MDGKAGCITINCGCCSVDSEKGESIIVEGICSSSEPFVRLDYPRGFNYKNSYIRAFNICGEFGNVTIFEEGIYAQLQEAGICVTIGKNEKWNNYGFIVELAKR